jgi:hypothetical protein
MMESLDVFEDAPKYYSKMVERIQVTEIVEEDEKFKFAVS